mmetsp:Transcript_21578/g.30224  ORF Transcript_21578/g.30224 Transcript_21578/m.30224 type:complete len:216 (+) Transcript_21578:106-753(+)|eukprot:CAMPEP_0184868108 /NCGR_PEP_ID=MMETSP0580-20130426/29182_1 /TAXON_ID=1118495 /ORGANISM="Dactyliosolen fragilissimus" /LENGTH=215 /DNA_ID=CAMNT_0027368773 /DNA_START=59 /DNA_END=706 /DNA_ORIENTATION=-
MPKVSKINKQRTKRSSQSTSLSSSSSPTCPLPEKDSVQGNALSRGQRKRQAKRDQYLKREKMVLSSLRLKQVEDQKNRLDGLDSIKEELMRAMEQGMTSKNSNADGGKGENSTQSPVNAVVKTNKAKKKIQQMELTQMNLVLQHPSFRANPFATMKEHLQNSFAKEAEEQEITAEKKRKEQDKLALERKELRKERIRDHKFNKTKMGQGLRRKKR